MLPLAKDGTESVAAAPDTPVCDDIGFELRPNSKNTEVDIFFSPHQAHFIIMVGL